MNKALVIFSGGLDSTVALYWAKKHFDAVSALTFRYGSKHNGIEYRHALLTCARLDVQNQLIPLDFIGEYFKSDLLQNGGAIPEGSYNAENMKSTVVPFRNGIMLAAAAGYAESNGFDALILGNHAGDHTIYPDCRPEFVRAMGQAIESGTDAHIRLMSPFCEIDKAEIVRIGQRLGVDFSLTYSCYKGGEKHCGVCGTCTERREAFLLAGVPDPTEYEV